MIQHDPRVAQLLTQLRACRGLCIHYEGEGLELRDVINAEGLLIFHRYEAADQLQADQHGDPRRLAPGLREIPALAPNGAGPSEAAKRLLTARAGP